MKRIQYLFVYMVIVLVWVNINQFGVEARTQAKAPTEMGNVVVFAYFEGTSEADIAYMKSPDFYSRIKNLFDDQTVTSFSGYMETISYGQLLVENIFPQDMGGYFDAIELPMTREDTKGRYLDEVIINYIVERLPGDAQDSLIDKNGDGYVDNFTVVLQGSAGSTSVEYPTIWPHQSSYLGEGRVGGKGIHVTNFLTTQRLLSPLSGAGLIAHEFMHSIGYPDLYTNDVNEKPVGSWDIMAEESSFLQYPLAYMRKHVSDWITIDEVTSSTANLVVHDQSNRNGNQAYIVKSPLSEHELFVVEYREEGVFNAYDETFLDAKIPGTGLIIYRVDTTVTSLSNKVSDDIAVYVFRENNSIEESFWREGDIVGTSDLSQGEEQGALTLSNGKNSGIVIDQIQQLDTDGDGKYDAMSFTVEVPSVDIFDVWESSVYVDDLPSSGNKHVVSALYEGDLYVMASSGSELAFSCYDGEVWSYNLPTPPIAFNNDTSNADLLISGEKLYYSFIEYQGSDSDIVVKEYNFTTRQWLDGDKLRVKNGAYSGTYDLQVVDGDLVVYYLEYVQDGKAYEEVPTIQIVNDYSSKKVQHLDKQSGQGSYGSLNLSIVNGRMFTFLRDAVNNKVIAYELIDERFQAIADADIATHYFDIYEYGTDIFLLSTFYNFQTGLHQVQLDIYEVENATWRLGNLLSKDVVAPKMAVSQGKLYMICEDMQGDIFAYRYEDSNGTWTQEGEAVESSGRSLNLESVGDNLYAVLITNNPLQGEIVSIKKKETTNKLLSLTVKPPSKLVYFVGETVDYSGIEVYANYVRGSQLLSKELYNVNMDTNTIGEQRGYIDALGMRVSFEYTVREKIEVVDPDPTLPQESVFGDTFAEWQLAAVEAMYRAGLMTGKGVDANGKFIFDPNGMIKREEITQILYSYEGRPIEHNLNIFEDVKLEQWYTVPVLWAANKGYVSGYGNGEFGVGDNITREQLMMILYNYVKLNAGDISIKGDVTSFNDANEISSWAEDAMAWAVGNGYMNGKGNGRLDPKGNATRAESAVIITKVFQVK